MGGSYSASASSGAESGNKIGPVTFGGVSFGNSAGGGTGSGLSGTTLAIIGVAAAALFFLIKK